MRYIMVRKLKKDVLDNLYSGAGGALVALDDDGMVIDFIYCGVESTSAPFPFDVNAPYKFSYPTNKPERVLEIRDFAKKHEGRKLEAGVMSCTEFCREFPVDDLEKCLSEAITYEIID